MINTSSFDHWKEPSLSFFPAHYFMLVCLFLKLFFVVRQVVSPVPSFFSPQDFLHVTIFNTSPVNVTYTPASKPSHPANKMVSPTAIWFVNKFFFVWNFWRNVEDFCIIRCFLFKRTRVGACHTGDIFSAGIYVSSSFLRITYFNIRFEPPSQNPVFCSCICAPRLQVQSDNGIRTLSDSQ